MYGSMHSIFMFFPSTAFQENTEETHRNTNYVVYTKEALKNVQLLLTIRVNPYSLRTAHQQEQNLK